jgi:hypothetical protein
VGLAAESRDQDRAPARLVINPFSSRLPGMSTQSEKAQNFLALHRKGAPLLIPNPWDIGSARVFALLGFQALATTSGGFAGTLGRPDGSVSR